MDHRDEPSQLTFATLLDEVDDLTFDLFSDEHIRSLETEEARQAARDADLAARLVHVLRRVRPAAGDRQVLDAYAARLRGHRVRRASRTL